MKNKKIKILLCSPIQKVGGITKWTNNILDYYKDNNNIIDLQHYYYSKGEKIVALATTSFFRRCVEGIQTYFKFYIEFSRIVKQQSFDVVHFCTSASISLTKDIILLKTAKKRGLKTIIHFRFGRIPELYNKKNWEQKLLHQVIKIADSVIVIDELSYKTLINSGYNNIELLPNPLFPKISQMIIDNNTIAKIDRKIVFAGHVIKTKGVYELVEACRDIENIQLKMLGYVSDEMKNELINLAGINNDWLDIAGEQSSETIIKEMLSAGVFVLPTYTEGFPNVILESMACACPIVTTTVGAIPEMLDITEKNNCGICVEPKNITELKNAISKMIEDRHFALECGMNAQKRVEEQYSMPIVWKMLCAIWNDVSDTIKKDDSIV